MKRIIIILSLLLICLTAGCKHVETEVPDTSAPIENTDELQDTQSTESATQPIGSSTQPTEEETQATEEETQATNTATQPTNGQRLSPKNRLKVKTKHLIGNR